MTIDQAVSLVLSEALAAQERGQFYKAEALRLVASVVVRDHK
jgi:hypothetical protein